MKYIKYFESSNIDYSKYTRDIEDVLQDLVDDGFLVNIETDSRNAPRSITITNNGKPFGLYDIYDYILTVRDVIDSSNSLKTYDMIRVAENPSQVKWNGYGYGGMVGHSLKSQGNWIGFNYNYSREDMEGWRKYYKVNADYNVYGIYMVISLPDGDYYRLSFDNTWKNGFRTYEGYNYRGMNYEYEWCFSNSPLRLRIDRCLRDILIEATDLGFGVTTGWLNEPYVWIGTKLTLKSEPISKRFNSSELEDVIERVKHYLTIEGMVITHIDELKNQIYIYFNKPEFKNNFLQ